MPKQTVRDLDVAGKKVLVRVDFNVPQSADGRVADDRRIRGALPTLKSILDRGGSLILVSHLGRPTGDPAADAPFRLDPVAARLQELIVRPVRKVRDTVGPEAEAACASSSRAGSSCSKTSGSTRARRRAIPILPSGWRDWRTAT